MKIIRPFKTADLKWIKPMAQEYGEWDGVCEMLSAAMEPTHFSAIRVVEPFAIAAVWNDFHGFALAGLAGKAGIKSLIRLGTDLIAAADKAEIDLHSHCTDPKTWQHKLFVDTYNFRLNGDVLAHRAGTGVK